MNFIKRLNLLRRPKNMKLFASALRGIEREALRVNSQGRIADTPHPIELGSALTHPNITTDYSEALLEFITEPQTSVPLVMAQLEEILAFSTQNIGSELLWTNSMPCQLGEDQDIPVANYGSSNIGRMKTLYRVGLGLRYGRAMQCIAGIHFNYSLPDATWAILRQQEKSFLTLQDYKTQGYLALIRNFRRRIWLLLYLMGAAPAVCRSFVRNRDHSLAPLADQHSLHAPLGTSIRMGELGYQSSAQDAIVVCYNRIENYIAELRRAILEPVPEYQKLGIKNSKGEFQQLNAGLLQIENEFYSTIRPKQTARRGETQLRALAERGIEYIEVRCLDLNPFSDLGIEEEQLYFIEVFLIGCLLDDSPEIVAEEYVELQANQKTVVNKGRDPQLTLRRNGSEVSLSEWATEIFANLSPIASMLDEAMQTSSYSDSVNTMRARLEDSSLTPAARILAELEKNQSSFMQWTLKRSIEATDRLQSKKLSEESLLHFQDLAMQSIAEQQRLESKDNCDFSEYLDRYYQQYRDLEVG